MTINIDGRLSTAGSFGVDPPDPCTCDWAPAGHTEDDCGHLCTACGTDPQTPLDYKGHCQSCAYEEELQWGYVPSYLGVRTGPAA